MCCFHLQTWAFVLLAVVGGWVASVFTSFNTWVCLVRKRWSKFFSFRILEVRSATSISPRLLLGQESWMLIQVEQQDTMQWLHHAVCACHMLHTFRALLSRIIWLCSRSKGRGADNTIAAVHVQVCVISIITSIVLFAVPLGGRCKTCDTQDPEHCVKGERETPACILMCCSHRLPLCMLKRATAAASLHVTRQDAQLFPLHRS